MGTSRSAAELSRKLKTAGDPGVAQMSRQGVADAALHAKGIIQREMAVSGLTPGKALSGDRRKRKVNAGYDLLGKGNNSTALVKVRGPGHWMNMGTKPHLISSRKNNRRGLNRRLNAAAMFGVMSGTGDASVTGTLGKLSSGRKGAILTPQGLRLYARHPGAEGKGYWSRAERAIRLTAPRLVQRNIRGNLKWVFK